MNMNIRSVLLLAYSVAAHGASFQTLPSAIANLPRGGGGYPPGWSPYYPILEEPVEGSVLVTFDYMEAFMMETFRSYGVSEEEATIATDVLLEADKRGISSHGIGRLKPIYCDRIDAGIMTSTAPITVVRD